MRRLLPTPAEDVDPEATYRDVDRTPAGARPWVVANMIASADGTASVQGRSGGLGGTADRAVFSLLRSLADVVVAGAATVRVEGYRPVTRPRPTPIAVISRSLDLDLTTPLFTEAVARTIVLTCEAADADRRRSVAEHAEVVVAGEDRVEPDRAMAALAARGHRLVLCEGGPTFLADLAGAGELDELCLTVAPLLAGGDGPRVLTGPSIDPPLGLHLDSVLEDEGFLLLRYLVAR